MKLISKEGLLYKPAKWLRVIALDWAFRYETPKLLDKSLKCVPCRFFWLSCIATYFLFLRYWNLDLNYLFYPFIIASMSCFLYRFINPNHEEN